jgi:cytoplasmic iron level regulating protein YaaA (DUF328/UPF0246 family)
MFVVISPAKKLDFESPLPTLHKQTEPRFLNDSTKLIKLLRDLSPADLSALMHVSDKIAHLNAERFALWRKDMTDEAAARAAAFAFRGDTYVGLDIDHFNKKELGEAQKRLRILSGLYGLLRPLDRIRPYRLEMGSSLTNEKGADLYHFWGDKLTRLLTSDMEEQGSKVLVNLASQEYFKAIREKMLPFPIISPVFEDERNGQYKVIGLFAKKARGMMTAWILKSGITKAEELVAFDVAGYAYSKEVSSPNRPVFRRSERALKAG